MEEEIKEMQARYTRAYSEEWWWAAVERIERETGWEIERGVRDVENNVIDTKELEKRLEKYVVLKEKYEEVVKEVNWEKHGVKEEGEKEEIKEKAKVRFGRIMREIYEKYKTFTPNKEQMKEAIEEFVECMQAMLEYRKGKWA